MGVPEKMQRMPSFMAICVDEIEQGLVSGRLYNLYQKESQDFCDIVELLAIIDTFLDSINTPEPTVALRKFKKVNDCTAQRVDLESREYTAKDLIKKFGKKYTFFISIYSRNNATIQGEIFNCDKDKLVKFVSEIELLQFVNQIIENV